VHKVYECSFAKISGVRSLKVNILQSLASTCANTPAWMSRVILKIMIS